MENIIAPIVFEFLILILTVSFNHLSLRAVNVESKSKYYNMISRKKVMIGQEFGTLSLSILFTSFLLDDRYKNLIDFDFFNNGYENVNMISIFILFILLLLLVIIIKNKYLSKEIIISEKGNILKTLYSIFKGNYLIIFDWVIGIILLFISILIILNEFKKLFL